MSPGKVNLPIVRCLGISFPFWGYDCCCTACLPILHFTGYGLSPLHCMHWQLIAWSSVTTVPAASTVTFKQLSAFELSLKSQSLYYYANILLNQIIKCHSLKCRRTLLGLHRHSVPFIVNFGRLWLLTQIFITSLLLFYCLAISSVFCLFAKIDWDFVLLFASVNLELLVSLRTAKKIINHFLNRQAMITYIMAVPLNLKCSSS